MALLADDPAPSRVRYIALGAGAIVLGAVGALLYMAAERASVPFEGIGMLYGIGAFTGYAFGALIAFFLARIEQRDALDPPPSMPFRIVLAMGVGLIVSPFFIPWGLWLATKANTVDDPAIVRCEVLEVAAVRARKRDEARLACDAGGLRVEGMAPLRSDDHVVVGDKVGLALGLGRLGTWVVKTEPQVIRPAPPSSK